LNVFERFFEPFEPFEILIEFLILDLGLDAFKNLKIEFPILDLVLDPLKIDLGRIVFRRNDLARVLDPGFERVLDIVVDRGFLFGPLIIIL